MPINTIQGQPVTFLQIRNKVTDDLIAGIRHDGQNLDPEWVKENIDIIVRLCGERTAASHDVTSTDREWLRRLGIEWN